MANRQQITANLLQRLGGKRKYKDFAEEVNHMRGRLIDPSDMSMILEDHFDEYPEAEAKAGELYNVNNHINALPPEAHHSIREAFKDAMGQSKLY